MNNRDIEKLQSFTRKAKINMVLSDSILSRAMFFSNIWTTLLAPVIIGLGISYLYSLNANTRISGIFYLLTFIFLLVHCAVGYLLHKNGQKFSLYSEAFDISDEYTKNISSLRDELAKYKHAYKELGKIHSNQRSTLYLVSLTTDRAVGEFNKFEVEGTSLSENEFNQILERNIHSIIRPVALEREALFGYESNSMYNIALYGYDTHREQLSIILRDCDNRLPRRNRVWKPGHGHVGLAFLHKQIKICPDITKSHELISQTDIASDTEYYRSFISIPILRCDDDGNVENGLLPLGVLVLTSAKTEQFNENRDLQFLNIISKNLAIYLATAESYVLHNGYVDSENNCSGE